MDNISSHTHLKNCFRESYLYLS